MRAGTLRYTVRVLCGAWIASAVFACGYAITASSNFDLRHIAAGSVVNSHAQWLPPLMVIGHAAHGRSGAARESTANDEAVQRHRGSGGNVTSASPVGPVVAAGNRGFATLTSPDMQTCAQPLPASVNLGPKASVWRQAGRRYHVDPLLLYAIALVETGHATGEDEVAPTPWIVRIDGHVITGSESHVCSAIRLAQVFGKPIQDVGVMQVYFPMHHTAVRNPLHLIEPRTNIMEGARILAQSLGSSQDTIIGIGHYHSYAPSKAYSYGRAEHEHAL